jgi:hypothetical protein
MTLRECSSGLAARRANRRQREMANELSAIIRAQSSEDASRHLLTVFY